MVPEGGFEPPTRGFSIRCSTPELLGLHGKNRVGAQPIERRSRPWQAQNQSQKSSLVVEVDAVFIIGGRPRHAVAIAKPLQQIAVFTALTAKRCKIGRCGLFAQRTAGACGLMR